MPNHNQTQINYSCKCLIGKSIFLFNVKPDGEDWFSKSSLDVLKRIKESWQFRKNLTTSAPLPLNQIAIGIYQGISIGCFEITDWYDVRYVNEKENSILKKGFNGREPLHSCANALNELDFTSILSANPSWKYKGRLIIKVIDCTLEGLIIEVIWGKRDKALLTLTRPEATKKESVVEQKSKSVQVKNTDQEYLDHPDYNRSYALAALTLGKNATHEQLHAHAKSLLDLPEDVLAKALRYD